MISQKPYIGMRMKRKLRVRSQNANDHKKIFDSQNKTFDFTLCFRLS